MLDEHTLAFPSYDGNGMYLSTGNVLVNPDVGMLFIDFERGHRMRLEGTASIDLDDPLRGDYPEAQFVVRVRARAVYPNCPRYIHRYELVRRSRFVPQERLPDAGARSGSARTGRSTRCPRATPPATPATATCSAAERTVHTQPVGSALKGALANVRS